MSICLTNTIETPVPPPLISRQRDAICDICPALRRDGCEKPCFETQDSPLTRKTRSSELQTDCRLANVLAFASLLHASTPWHCGTTQDNGGMCTMCCINTEPRTVLTMPSVRRNSQFA